jgi:hypothetical protein
MRSKKRATVSPDNKRGTPRLPILEDVDWSKMPKSMPETTFWSRERGTKVTFSKSVPDHIPYKPKKFTWRGTRLALVPVVYETEAGSPSIKVNQTDELNWLDGDNVSEDERKLFYEQLLSIPWLPAKLRSALRKETITFRRRLAKILTYDLWLEINECKHRLRSERDQARWQKKYPNQTEWFKRHPNLTDGRTRFPRHS